MNLLTLFTHSVAIIIGWMIASTFHTSSASQESEHPNNKLTHSLKYPSNSSSFYHKTTPLAVLTALSHTSMESHRRLILKYKIYHDWAKTDPTGLVEYHKDRPWPKLYGFNAPFDQLAKTRPAYLLDYAREQGCMNALSSLSYHGDPRVVLKLYLSQKPNSIPPGQFHALFESGSELDPNFHLNLEQINDPAARNEAFRGAASVMLGINRYDTYFPWLEEQLDFLNIETVTTDFTTHLLQQSKDVRLLKSLPERIQPFAILNTITSLDQIGSNNDTYKRDSLTTFIHHGWFDDHINVAQNIILFEAHTISSDNTHIQKAEAWKNWALELPNEKKWQPLQETAVRRWMVTTPSEWEKITTLPTLGLRDAAYTAALYNIDLEKEAANISWIMSQISDPDYRRVAAKVLELRDTEDGDPFGLDLDPFEPFKE